MPTNLDFCLAFLSTEDNDAVFLKHLKDIDLFSTENLLMPLPFCAWAVLDTRKSFYTYFPICSNETEALEYNPNPSRRFYTFISPKILEKLLI